MAKVENLEGRKFGHLLVVDRAENAPDGSSQWNCLCDCGNPEIIIVKGTALRAGLRKSCGCYTKLIDLTGRTFGRLTVVGRERIQGSPKWRCYCSCGNPNPVIVYGSNLRRGITKSCGCLSREIAQEKNKSYNHFEFTDDYVVGTTSSGSKFYVDPEDFELIKDICWHDTGTGYVSGKTVEGTEVLLHRFILDAPKNSFVDHINHNRKDNRKSNLRIVNQSQNMQNSKLSKTNRSGVTGVSWFERDKKWRASITINYKAYNLGVYGTIEEAAAARKAAEEKYFGQYSYDNSMAASPMIDVA